MSTKLRRSGAAAVLEVDGKLKMGESVDQLRTQWTEAINGGAKFLVILLGNVPMIDSSGVGSLMLDAVLLRDYTLIQGAVLFFAAVIVATNLLVDLSYAWLDPRIRYR